MPTDQELIAQLRDPVNSQWPGADLLRFAADHLEAANRREAKLQGPLNHRLLANLDVITMQEHGLRLDEQATREADWRASLVTEHLESEAALEAVIAKVAAMTTSNAQVREGHVCVEVGYITRVLIDAPHAALDVVIADAKAEQRETDGDVTRLADMIHRAMDYQYDECQHGTYSGGVSHGEPYRMCEIFARRVSAELRKAAE